MPQKNNFLDESTFCFCWFNPNTKYRQKISSRDHLVSALCILWWPYVPTLYTPRPQHCLRSQDHWPTRPPLELCTTLPSEQVCLPCELPHLQHWPDASHRGCGGPPPRPAHCRPCLLHPQRPWEEQVVTIADLLTAELWDEGLAPPHVCKISRISWFGVWHEISYQKHSSSISMNF